MTDFYGDTTFVMCSIALLKERLLLLKRTHAETAALDVALAIRFLSTEEKALLIAVYRCFRVSYSEFLILIRH